MKKIINLTNSPFDLASAEGPVRVPAFGSAEAEFDDAYLQALIAGKAVRLADEDEPEEPAKVLAQPTAAAKDEEHPLQELRDKYEKMSRRPAGKRWNEARLLDEIAKLKG